MGVFSKLKLVAAAGFCAALSGCIVPSTDSLATAVSQDSNKVILVGAFEINPPIPQRFANRPSQSLFGSAEDVLGERLVTGFLPQGTRASRGGTFATPWTGTTHAVPLNDLFFIEVPRTAIALQQSQYFRSDNGVDSIRLPGGLVTATHPTAQVVCVGKVRFTRDDFLAITDVRVIDNCGQAAAAARARFGSGTTVANATWRRAR